MRRVCVARSMNNYSENWYLLDNNRFQVISYCWSPCTDAMGMDELQTSTRWTGMFEIEEDCLKGKLYSIWGSRPLWPSPWPSLQVVGLIKLLGLASQFSVCTITLLIRHWLKELLKFPLESSQRCVGNFTLVWK